MPGYIDGRRPKEGGCHFERWPICSVASSARPYVSAGLEVLTLIYPAEVQDVRVERRVVAEFTGSAGFRRRRPDELLPRREIPGRDQCADLPCESPSAPDPTGGRPSRAKRTCTVFRAAFTFEVAAQHVIRRSGCHGFPCVVPALDVRSPDRAYATGPMSERFRLHIALELTGVKALEAGCTPTSLSPALAELPEDGSVLDPAPVRLGPQKEVVVMNSVVAT